MIQKAFAGIDKDDIDSLVTNQVKEGRTIEYKATLPGVKDAEKKEFLADVSSFANAAGGDLLYGVVEKRDEKNEPTGIPERIAGLPGLNADVEIRRLHSMIQAGIGPRIAGVHLRTVDGFRDGPVLLIRVRKSYSAPHMVTFQEHSRFYSRNSSGKYPLDVGEIRAAFALSESLPEKIRRFRDERIARIVADETPVPLFEFKNYVRLVMHVVPVVSLDSTFKVDLACLANDPTKMQPMGSSSWDSRYNFDGLVSYDRDQTRCWAYSQVFRSGAIESVNGGLVQRASQERNVLDFEYCEKMLLDTLQVDLGILRYLGVESPAIVLLSILGVRGYALGGKRLFRGGHRIDREDLLLPDVLVEDLAQTAATILRPAFDTVWQAAGWPESPSYDGKGTWRPR
jgi:hypothetical protein